MALMRSSDTTSFLLPPVENTQASSTNVEAANAEQQGMDLVFALHSRW